MKIFIWNLISNSYFQGNLVEPYFLSRISTGSLFSRLLILNKIWFPYVSLEITKRTKIPTRIIPLGTLFPTVNPRET
jgi:hypothetical protein